MLHKLSDRFKIWIYKQYQQGRELYYEVRRDDFDDPSVSKLNSSGISFSLYQASGGWVVEVQQSNSMNEDTCNLYIIPSDDDIGKTLTKILTLENLKK